MSILCHRHVFDKYSTSHRHIFNKYSSYIHHIPMVQQWKSTNCHGKTANKDGTAYDQTNWPITAHYHQPSHFNNQSSRSSKIMQSCMQLSTSSIYNYWKSLLCTQYKIYIMCVNNYKCIYIILYIASVCRDYWQPCWLPVLCI